MPENSDLVAYGDDDRMTSTLSVIPPRADKYPDQPFESDAPTHLLSRTQRLGVYAWTDGMPAKQIYVPCKLATALTNIVNFDDYEYFSYKSVTCRFTLNSTPYFCGLLGITYLPGNFASEHILSLPSLMQLPTHIIDASVTGTTLYEFEWPLALPRSNIINFPLGSIVMYPITPLFNSADPTAVPSLQIILEANFNDPELTVQSNDGLIVVNLPDTTAVLMNTPCYTQLQGLTPKKEAKDKAEKGVLTGIAEATKNVASVVKHVPIVGGIAAGVEVIASAAETVFSWFGLSKPPTDSLAQFVLPTSSFGENYFHGVSMAHSLSRNPIPLVASDPALVGVKTDTTDLIAIAQRESYWRSFTIPADATVDQLLLTFPVHPNIIFGTPNPTMRFCNHLGYAASFFGLWSGSIKYRLKVASTKFMKARIAIVWTPAPGATYSSNYRREVYTIEGTTDIEFTVPWTNPEPYRPLLVPSGDTAIGATRHNGFISIFVSAPLLNTAPSDPEPLTCLLFNAGGENIQFANYTGLNYASAPAYEPPALARTKSIEIAQGAFGATDGVVLGGIVDEDNIRSLREIGKDRVQFGAYSVTIALNQPYPIDYTSTHRLMHVLRKFKYWRGSLTIGCLSATWTGTGAMGFHRPGTTNLHVYHPVINPYVALTYPFLEHLGYYSTGTCADPAPYGPQISFSCYTGNTNETRFYVSTQDDLVTGLLLPSPLFRSTP